MQWAFPFAKPVDVTIFKDYPIIITQPIDFATIKSKLDGARYKQPQQFHDDMKLVFANARRYNPPGSDVNLMANGVEVSTIKAFRKAVCTSMTRQGAAPLQSSMHQLLVRLSLLMVL